MGERTITHVDTLQSTHLWKYLGRTPLHFSKWGLLNLMAVRLKYGTATT